MGREGVNVTENQDIRWKQRFQNFQKALRPLEKAISFLKDAPDNEIYQMATIQAFEFCFELAWKTLKDFLTYEGLSVENLPRNVIKDAFNVDLIQNGQLWIAMLRDRNILSHEYHFEKTQLVSLNIVTDYFDEFLALQKYFQQKLGG